MPTSDHRAQTDPVPAVAPAGDESVATLHPPTLPAALRAATVDRLAAVVHRLGDAVGHEVAATAPHTPAAPVETTPRAGAIARARDTIRPLAHLVGDVALGAASLAAAGTRSAVLGIGQGMRDGLAAVVEGVAGAAAMAGAPDASAPADRAAGLRRGWARAFADDAHGLLAGQAAAGAVTTAVQASPAIAALPLGAGASAAIGGIVPAGIAATEAREAGADPGDARRRGLEAGAAAAALTGVAGGTGTAAPAVGGGVGRLLVDPVARLDGAARALAKAAVAGADRAAEAGIAQRLRAAAPEPSDPAR